MKYLKQFESSFYSEIEGTEYRSMIDVCLVFSHSELNEIRNFCHRKSCHRKGVYKVENPKIIKISSPDTVIYVRKSYDEWFYISCVSSKYGITEPTTRVNYKCDQMDGLIKCLKDLL